MSLEKKKNLRKVEFTCTNNECHPSAHLQYDIVVLENGREVASSVHRETVARKDALEMVQRMEEYVYPEE